jgi:threonine/homoserine/homoserine lactone efflux protein
MLVGLRRTLPHLLGVCLGFTLMVFVVGLGLHQLFDRLPAAQVALKIISALYLTVLAIRIATSSPPEPAASPGAAPRPLTFLAAALFQWVNPRAWTMALTGSAAYMPAGHPASGVLLVAAIFGLINLPSILVWAWLGVQMQRILGNPRRLRLFNLAAAALLILSLYPLVFGDLPRAG